MRGTPRWLILFLSAQGATSERRAHEAPHAAGPGTPAAHALRRRRGLQPGGAYLGGLRRVRPLRLRALRGQVPPPARPAGPRGAGRLREVSAAAVLPAGGAVPAGLRPRRKTGAARAQPAVHPRRCRAELGPAPATARGAGGGDRARGTDSAP